MLFCFKKHYFLHIQNVYYLLTTGKTFYHPRKLLINVHSFNYYDYEFINRKSIKVLKNAFHFSTSTRIFFICWTWVSYFLILTFFYSKLLLLIKLFQLDGEEKRASEIGFNSEWFCEWIFSGFPIYVPRIGIKMLFAEPQSLIHSENNKKDITASMSHPGKRFLFFRSLFNKFNRKWKIRIRIYDSVRKWI